MAAYERARQLAGSDATPLFGLAITASLATTAPKRGAHRAHVVLQTESETTVLSLTLDKGARSRAETGGFDICPNCSIEYAIANAMLVWQTGMPNQPANYPAFLGDATGGEYFDPCCIQTKIYCIPIGTQPSSWGAIKSMYR